MSNEATEAKDHVEPEGYLPFAEAARRLQISHARLEYHLKKGHIKVYWAWKFRVLKIKEVAEFSRKDWPGGWPKGVKRQFHRGPAAKE